MDNDILLDVFRFLMREQIERFEIVCFHWHTLISNISSWNCQLPLRPVILLKIILQGNNNSFVQLTQYTTKYIGFNADFYTWEPNDIDKRLNESVKISRRSLILKDFNFKETLKDGLPPSLIPTANNGKNACASFTGETIILEAFEFRHLKILWNSCSIRHMRFHVCDAAIYSSLINGSEMDENINSENGFGMPNGKIDNLCLHITTNCLYERLLKEGSCVMKKENKFKNLLMKKNFFQSTRNIFKHHSSSSSASSTLQNSSSLHDDRFVKIDSSDNDERKIFKFVRCFAKALEPTVFCLSTPLPYGDMIACLMPLFPKPCYHIDLQGSGRISRDLIKLNIQQRALLMEMIFLPENYAHENVEQNKIKNKGAKNSAPPQWRRIWKAWHPADDDDSKNCGNGGCCEFAYTSLTIHPIQLDAEFIDQIIEHFCALPITNHLVGRRIHFSKKTDIGIDECFDDQIDEELHTIWREKCNAKYLYCSPRHGEYLIKNNQTGLEMCIQFGSHLYRCMEYHCQVEANTEDCRGKKIYPTLYCPYGKLFVLELYSTSKRE